MTRTTIALLAGLTLAFGCGEKKDATDKAPATDPTATDPSAAKPTTPDPATPTTPDPANPTAGTDPAAGTNPAAGTDPAAGAAAEIPTEQDFEEKAEKDIGDKNLEAEVKKLEKEIGK